MIAVLVATFAVALSAGTVLANGIGDLYAATPGGVLELHVASSRVVNTVDVAPAPRSLAFAPDGRSLYVASDGRHVVRIDIESLTTPDTIPLPVNAAALAFPAGATLVVALPAHKTLGLIAVPSTAVVESPVLPGAVDLLAADRHDPRVVAAQRGQSWVAVFEPADGSLRKTTVQGSITALAVDRDRGAALVATHAPDRIWRLELHDLHVTWQADLPSAPAAVAPTIGGVIAAGGTTLWIVDASGARKWGSTHGTVVALAASDDGHVVHVAEGTVVEAFDDSGRAARTISLGAGNEASALAAVPHGSSIMGGAGGSQPGVSVPGVSGSAPATSTEAGPAWLPFESPLLTAAAVAALILFACFAVIKIHGRRRTA